MLSGVRLKNRLAGVVAAGMVALGVFGGYLVYMQRQAVAASDETKRPAAR